MKKAIHITLMLFFVINILGASYLYIDKINHDIMISQNIDMTFVNKVILVDPGHGGHDNGTKGDDVLEDEINLLISKKLYERLITLGAITYISRVGDYDLASLYAKNRKDQDMQKRVYYINSLQVDAFISIHLNHFPNPNVSGAQVFYAKDNQKGAQLAKSIQSYLNELNKKDKAPKYGDYYLTNNSIYPGVIIECGFLSNYNDRKNLVLSTYQSILVDKIIFGLNQYFIENT